MARGVCALRALSSLFKKLLQLRHTTFLLDTIDYHGNNCRKILSLAHYVQIFLKCNTHNCESASCTKGVCLHSVWHIQVTYYAMCIIIMIVLIIQEDRTDGPTFERLAALSPQSRPWDTREGIQDTLRKLYEPSSTRLDVSSLLSRSK